MEDVRKNVNFGLVENRLEKLAEKGIIFLPGAIDDIAAANFVLEMLELRLKRGADDKTPVWVIIDSPGGDIFSGLTIYDTILMLIGKGMQINTFAIGLAASMGAVILQAGSRRFATPNAQFLLHKAYTISHGGEGEDEDDLAKRRSELRRVSDRILSIISQRSGMDLKKLKELFKDKRDYWLDATDASKFGPNGLVDEIVTAFPFEI